jgi:uncharacterized membrane protein YbhN (UPF0104 family)
MPALTAWIPTDPHWSMVLLAVAASLVSLTGAAWNLVGFAPVRLGLGPAWAAQLAGTAAKVMTPASTGTVAVNVRVLQRAGSPTGASLVSVTASQAAQLVVTALLVAGVAVFGGGDVPFAVPHVSPAVAAVVAVLVLAGAAAALWWWRRDPATARRAVLDPARSLFDVLRRPQRCLAGFGGCVLLTAGLVATLWASMRATGGEIGLLAVLVVLLAGSALGSTVPTPGGAGGVEAAMTAGLVAAGLPLAQAAPAVLLYRGVTFWLLVPAGAVAAAVLRRRALI